MNIQQLSMLAAFLEGRHKYRFRITARGWSVHWRGAKIKEFVSDENLDGIPPAEVEARGQKNLSAAVAFAVEHARSRGVKIDVPD